MKGITRYDGPKEGHGWLARTQWQGKLRRRRFAASQWGGWRGARSTATTWLKTINALSEKPTTERWVRSNGGWGRAGKRGKWQR